MFGQLPDFTNSFEFLRKLWASGSGMPSGLMPGLSAMTPPMDLEDIDKRIRDLQAVESWLQLNTNLLRTTIQGLEVQRATLVALQTFGNALSPEAMQTAMENVARAANAPSTVPPHQPHHYGTGETVSEAQADAENDEQEDEDIEAPAEAGASAEASASASDASAGTPHVPPNASLWWDLLQQQFNQIASTAAAAANVTPFSNLGAFQASPASDSTANPETNPGPMSGAPATGAGNGKSRPAAKKAATKPAAKKTAAAKKPAASKTPAKKAPAKAKPAQPETPPVSDTPEDPFE